MKKCSKCNVLQPHENFYRAKGTRDGLRGDCKSCFQARFKARYPVVREQAIARTQRWREENPEKFLEGQRRRRNTPEGRRRQRADYLRRKYDLTLDQYEAMLLQQNGLCGICECAPSKRISLHVDHDHETGDIHGLLCFNCNSALGKLNDPEQLRAAARYLDRFAPADPEFDEAMAGRLAELKALPKAWDRAS